DAGDEGRRLVVDGRRVEAGRLARRLQLGSRRRDPFVAHRFSVEPFSPAAGGCGGFGTSSAPWPNFSATNRPLATSLSASERCTASATSSICASSTSSCSQSNARAVLPSLNTL